MSSPASEQELRELVRQARAGRSEAFGKVVECCAPRLLRFLRSMGFGLHDAEDLAQDVFVAAYEALSRYDERYAFLTWLFTIARRMAISAIRHRRCAEEYASKKREMSLTSQGRGEEAKDNSIWEWARRSLPDRDYEAIWLHYGEGLSVAEVAKVMGISAIYVRVLLHRARQRLNRAAEEARTAAQAAPCLEGRW